MAFYTAVLFYEYAVLYFLAVARISAFVVGGTKVDLTLLALGVFYAQELLLAIVVGALFARIIQYAFGPHDVPLVYEFTGGLRGFVFPCDSSDLLNPERGHPKALEQVSGTGQYIMLLKVRFFTQYLFLITAMLPTLFKTAGRSTPDDLQVATRCLRDRQP